MSTTMSRRPAVSVKPRPRAATPRTSAKVPFNAPRRQPPPVPRPAPLPVLPRSTVAAAPARGPAPTTVAPSSTAVLHQVTTVEHQGVVIAFAREQGTGAVYYDVLDLKVSAEVDDAEWTGYTKLDLPAELRPVGLGIVTVPDQDRAVLEYADAPLKAVSDDAYVHVFQQSKRGTLLLNRFLYKRVVPEGGDLAIPVLEPAWEVRYQRSGKQDVPAGAKDIPAFTTPDGEPFIEPTLELPMVHGLTEGRFAAQLLPDQSGVGRRWQFFGVNDETGKIDCFSFPVDPVGLPDVTPRDDEQVDENGNVKPDMSLSLALEADGAQSDLALAGMPTAALFTLHERVRTDSGDDLLLKRTTRDLLAIPVTTATGERRFATLDFAVGRDGGLARPPQRVVATPVNPANYALEFAQGTYLALPAAAPLSIHGCFRVRFLFYPGSEIDADQYVLRGDPAVAPERAAPYLKITRDLRVEFGYGDGTAAVAASTARPVVRPGRWIEIEACFDDREPKAFSILVNGRAVPVDQPRSPNPPQGEPLKYVGGPPAAEPWGLVGVLDDLKLEQLVEVDGARQWAVSGYWKLDEIDYKGQTPTTPDSSDVSGPAQVHGAILVASSAPVADSDTQGRLYVDAAGLSCYAGLLTFAEPAASGSLLTGAGGLVHLYFASRGQGTDDGVFSVAQYDAESARAVFEAGWRSAAGQSGTVSFTAARSGVFMNEAVLTLAGGTADEGLCDLEIDDRQGHRELWRGVPRRLDAFVAVLNGASTHDVADPAFLAGKRTFYDNGGTYRTARLKARSHGVDAAFTLMSRRPAALQLAAADVAAHDADKGTLTLTYAVPDWEPITQTWRDVPLGVAALTDVLSGVSTSYPYRETGTSNAGVYGLAAQGGGRTHDIVLIAKPGTGELRVEVGAGSTPDTCKVTVETGEEGHRVELTDVPREQNGFAEAVNTGATRTHLRAVTDGLTATVPDRELAEPPRLGLRAWTGILAAFPQDVPAPDAVLTAQSVPADFRQGSTLTVDAVERPLDGPSTLIRALADSRPTDGTPADVQDTAGPANLAIAAVSGGWIRVSPHKAIALSAGNHVAFDTPPPASDVLAIAGDLTVEAWCRPGTIDYGSSPDTLRRPRLANYYRLGSPEYPDDAIRWTLGLWPAPALRFGNTTEVGYAPSMPEYPDCTFQLTFTPAAAGKTGNLQTLRTVGASKDYLRCAVDGAQRLAVFYLGAASPVLTSTATVAPGRWTQVTITLRKENAGPLSPVRIALYIDGRLDTEQVAQTTEFKDAPASFVVGQTSGAMPMLANGTYLWRRALSAAQVAGTGLRSIDLDDPDLLVAWSMTEGEGKFLINRAASGAGTRSQIINVDRQGWSPFGAYGTPWAANGFHSITARQPVMHGWHHLASSYRSGFSLALDGAAFADCGHDASLDATDNFSVEAYFTPANSGDGGDQNLVSKPGNYELRIDALGAVVAAVSTDLPDGGVVEVRSTGGTGPDYRVERDVPCYAAAVVSTGSVPPATGQDNPGPPLYFIRVQLYVDGVLRGEFLKEDLEDPVYVQTSSRNLNLGRSGLGGAYFSGLLSDVRLWNLALSAEAIDFTQATHEPPSTHGLVSAWRWSEGSGKYGYDDNGLNTAVLSANNLWRLYRPTARLTLVVDGVEQTDPRYDTTDVDELMYGSAQFTAGAARRAGGRVVDNFTGALSELRVWNRARTAEQIREDMYRVLTGAETGLAGYWEFNTGSGARALDATGNGNTGTLAPAADPPAWIDGRAPLSNEAKEVFNVLGGQITEFTERITGTPSVSEYADARFDAYGGLYSVMKRSYGADRLGVARLNSGYTVGDLDPVYAGQVQTDPSVVGFIEGAPPIPSENQTNPYWDDPAFWNSYADTAKTRVTHAESVTRTFSGEQTDGSSNAVAAKAGVFFDTDFTEGVGLGTEIDWTIATAEGRVGVVGELANGTRSGRELGFGFGKTTTTVDEISCGGDWEDPEHPLNPAVGRRYVPENHGYAVVKSLTADMYLLMVKGSNTVVRTLLTPDPDIPEDVNVITFPINPRYTKNGTLDGMVGFETDPDYPDAGVQRGSYFKPIEAYALKRAVERQDKQLEAYYQQFNTTRHSRAPHATEAGTQESGFTELRDRTLAGQPSYDWAKGLSKRAIVNTYVWSAGGGLHTEQSEIVDTRSESFSGLSSVDSRAGVAADLAVGVPAGLFAELDATYGTSVEVVSVRRKESETGFSLEVEFAPERFLKAPVLGSDGQPTGFTEQAAPGKVTGYRFMSFLIPQNADNFRDFTGFVVDPNWLHNSADPDAAALRTATAQANGVWRVLHRTTYVSRVAPPLQPAPVESIAPPVEQPAGLEGNALLVRLIEKRIGTPTPTPAQIGEAVTAALGTSRDSAGLLGELLPWWAAFLTQTEDVRSDAYRTLAALRVDLLAYMEQKYAADLVRAGAKAVRAG